MKRIPDINNAKKILNYSPKINLDEGIEKVAKHRQKINSDK